MKRLAKAFLLSLMLFNQAYAKEMSDSGEGRNGPDIEGYSIPVSFDQFISLVHFESAEQFCIKKQRQSILEQILRKKLNFYFEKRSHQFQYPGSYARVHYKGKLLYKNIKIWKAVLEIDDRDYDKGQMLVNLFHRSYTTDDEGYKLADSQESMFPSVELDDQDYKILNNFIDRSTDNKQIRSIYFNGGIRTKVDYEYVGLDILGYANNILVKSFEIYNTPLMRRNGKENLSTPLSMNSEEFKECLFSNVSKKLDKMYEDQPKGEYHEYDY